MRKLALPLTLAFCALGQAPETEATRRLRLVNQDFHPRIVRVSESVYSAIGYGFSVFPMIVGSDGFVMIDAGQNPDTSAAALAEFRKHSSLPIKAIIYTHGHGAHSGGTPALAKRATA